MPPPTARGPSSFGEWIVGTTVRSALNSNSGGHRSRRRGLFRFEVSTDDESQEDSLRITYPRTGPRQRAARQARNVATGVKQVRFEDEAPKSVLKKTTTVVTSDPESGAETDTSEESSASTTEASSSEADTSTSGDSTTDSSDSSSETPNDTDKKKRRRRRRRGKGTKKATTKPEHDDDSDDDSEPHPTCKCSSCVRGRRRMKDQQDSKSQKERTSQDTSDSEANSKAQKRSKRSKKSKKKVKAAPVPEPESEDETTDEASASESEVDHPVSQRNNKKGLNKNKGKGNNPSGGKQNRKAKNQSAATQNKRMNEDNGDKNNGQKHGDYPEAFPHPHPRRPYYIEPVRAEVVQTERVIETPQDPPPNAYYDARNNIIRVYHGPVWGGNPGQSLYPIRDPSMRPLPVGMPHPTQNPYYNGFNHAPSQQQPREGMHWPGPPHPIAGYPPVGGPDIKSPDSLGMNRGAFAMSGANGPGNSSKDDAAGSNNIAPHDIKLGMNNPYYTGPKSRFGDWGSKLGDPHMKKGADGAAQGGPRSNRNNSPKDTWGANSNNGNQNDTGDFNNSSSSNNNNNNNNNEASWTGNDGNNQGGSNENQGTSWPGNNNNNPGWGNTSAQADNGDGANTGSNWDNEPAVESGSTPAGTVDNDIAPRGIHRQQMPGSWEENDPRGWADPTAAAATGGQVDDGTPW